MSEPFGQKKSSGLAITSFVLGILGFICLGIFSGLPAIICGHIARGNIKREPFKYEGAGLALAGLILGYLSLVSTIGIIGILTALALPAISGAHSAAEARKSLGDAKQIHLAIEQMVQDGKTTGDRNLGYPADAGIATASELKARLIKGGYLTEEDATRLHFADFQFGNLSATDPDDTIELRLDPAPPSHYFIVSDKNGNGLILLPRMKNLQNLNQPAPRDPAYLAP